MTKVADRPHVAGAWEPALKGLFRHIRCSFGGHRTNPSGTYCEVCWKVLK